MILLVYKNLDPNTAGTLVTDSLQTTSLFVLNVSYSNIELVLVAGKEGFRHIKLLLFLSDTVN